MKQHNDHSDEQDDAVLVARILAGERDAFDILFQRYEPGVQRLCTRLLGTTVEAQDVVQEAALQAFLGLSHLREPTRFAAWFHAIAANLARSALRRRNECSLERLEEETMTHLLWIDTPPNMEEYLGEQEMQEAILLALQDLSPAHRQAVIGFYLQGYHYEELALLLGVPLSTLKWRLFEGRRLLKTLLHPLAQTLFYPVECQPRKEKPLTTDDLVTLHIDSLRRLPFTRQHLAVLRDPASSRVLPVSLTEAEFNTLEVAFRARQDADTLAVSQDLAQRLLESFEAHPQQVVINAVVEQILYATVTLKQGKRLREVDTRLAEALVLAVRAETPIFIKRSLFETSPLLDLTTRTGPSQSEDLSVGRKASRKLGREERLQREEAVRHRYTTARSSWPEPFWERLWVMLLISLVGSPETMSAADLRTLDLATTFRTREVTWDSEPLIAIRLPDQRETGWLLISPTLWETITQQWQALRDPGQQNEQASLAANLVPDALTPHIQQQAEEMLARLVELPEVRTAFLLNPAGKVSAWKGPETRESLQRYCDTRNDLSGPSLAHAREFGQQGQQVQAISYMKQRATEREQPEAPGTGMLLAYLRSGWRLVVLFQEQRAEKVQEQTRQRIEETWQEFLHLLTQGTPG